MTWAARYSFLYVTVGQDALVPFFCFFFFVAELSEPLLLEPLLGGLEAGCTVFAGAFPLPFAFEADAALRLTRVV
jgi:hypothetical protein